MIAIIPPIIFLMLFPMKASSSEVVVCVPLDIAFDSGKNELSVLPNVNDELPDWFDGYLCNESRTWCGKVQLQKGVTIRLAIPEESATQRMEYFQTMYHAELGEFGCKYDVSM